MVGHVAQSVGGALPGVPTRFGLSGLNVISMQRFTSGNGTFSCPAGTVQAYLQVWGRGGARCNDNFSAAGAAWAADAIDANPGDVGNYFLPSAEFTFSTRVAAATAALNGKTVAAESGQNAVRGGTATGGQANNSTGRWKESGGAAGQSGNGLSAGGPGLNPSSGPVGGGAGSGHFSQAGRGGNFGGSFSPESPGGGAGGGAGNIEGGLPTLLIYFLGAQP